MIKGSNEVIRIKRFYKVGGEAWKPRSHFPSAVQLALGPQIIESPGPIAREEEAARKLTQLHSHPRILVRSLAMGNPLAKVGLTDLSARVMLETFLDILMHRNFRVIRSLDLNPTRSSVSGRPGSLPIRIDTLVDFLKTYDQLKGSGELYGLSELVRISGVDPENPRIPHSLGPVMAMFNGDDNLRLNESWGTWRACINTEKRGQAIEHSKTASSRKYLSYCQAPGFNPITRLVDIIRDIIERTDLKEDSTWTYDCSKRLYICNEVIRNKLLSQSSKGARDRNIADTDTSVTGRSSILTKEVSYGGPAMQLQAHFLHRVAFPQWYTNLGWAQKLPAGWGGIDCQDFTDPAEFWSHLPLPFQRAITLATGQDAKLAIVAGRLLNRHRASSSDLSFADEETRYAKGLEIVNRFNSLNPDRPIKLVNWQGASDFAVEVIKEKSQKSSSLISADGAYTPTIVSRIIRSQFVRLDWFDTNYLHVPFIYQVKSGTARIPRRPDPLRAHETVVRRLNRSKILESVEPIRPPGGCPSEWFRSATHAREGRLFISLEDFERVCPPRKFSLRLLPGVLSGLRDYSLNESKDRVGYRSVRIDLRRVDGALDKLESLTAPIESRFSEKADAEEEDDEKKEEIVVSPSLRKEPLFSSDVEESD